MTHTTGGRPPATVAPLDAATFLVAWVGAVFFGVATAVFAALARREAHGS